MPASPHIELPLALIHQGKVRDIYDIDKHNMLIVASDRLSAYDGPSDILEGLRGL